MIKVKFRCHNQPKINTGDICDFIHGSVNFEFFKAKFTGYSRIDGYPIFDILTNASYPISEYNLEYKSLKFFIENCELIKSLEDHTKYYNNQYRHNSTELLDLAKSVFNISEEDLQDETKFRSKIRNIKLSEILK